MNDRWLDVLSVVIVIVTFTVAVIAGIALGEALR